MKGCDAIKHLFTIMVCFLLLNLFAVTGFSYGYSEQQISLNNFSVEYKKYAYQKCKENNLSYEMFLAVAFNESRFTANAVHINKNGTVDRGLCQINDSCIPFLQNKNALTDKDDLFNPYINIDCYIALMKYHMDFTKNEDLALLRYQVGAGRYKAIMSGAKTTSTHQMVLKYKTDFKNYLSDNPGEIIDLYSLSNYRYLIADYPHLKTAINSQFNSFEWQGRYR